MNTIDARPDAQSAAPWRPHAEVSWWGMVLLCVTEAALFVYLVASYFYLGVANPAWPPTGIDRPALPLPLVMTVLLASSSVTLFMGERMLDRGRHGAYRAWATLTLVLGVLFLAAQASEFRTKLEHTSPQTHAYASLFYTITGFHGMHVIFGLTLIVWAMIQERTGRVDLARPMIVKNTSLYWHFVDGVWLVILTTLYLSPRIY
jgi:cytochrome c oxidase subunit 3